MINLDLKTARLQWFLRCFCTFCFPFFLQLCIIHVMCECVCVCLREREREYGNTRFLNSSRLLNLSLSLNLKKRDCYCAVDKLYCCVIFNVELLLQGTPGNAIRPNSGIDSNNFKTSVQIDALFWGRMISAMFVPVSFWFGAIDLIHLAAILLFCHAQGLKEYSNSN